MKAEETKVGDRVKLVALGWKAKRIQSESGAYFKCEKFNSRFFLPPDCQVRPIVRVEAVING